ncbi:putative zinc-binding alcohol dehydrogenase domain-containing protein cipb [Diaporthe ampelina]|uniref:Putative zinc-binding alcohol dehydrogenase domain-containing protein cipb n=1 Tax=Diaporthe ampelina TaxID=1214573 RepID=A0A0G2H3N9_9PEZI|nr:putative zinc-binding alcohol dehydrogenase domain-containing protein cipb [Diaporthe ampelina]
MPSNRAAILTATKAPLEIKEVPCPTPDEREIIVKNRAVAINPVDWFQQEKGPEVIPFLKYPAILGYDIAGEVEAVGPGVTKFKAGDRVAGLVNQGFQQHVLLSEHMATAIPSSVTFEQAAALPMGVSVATKALFHKDFLALDLPSASPSPKQETVLIWGGSTSVGSNVIQLAVAAGYEVITTASPQRFQYVKGLGASQVFDYESPTVKDDLVAAFKGKKVAGAIANGGVVFSTFPGIVEACAAVVLSTEGSKFVALTMVPAFPIPEGVQTKFVEELRPDVELASAVFHDFLAAALADGRYTITPRSEVVGEGLEALQGAMDILREGVSAKKIVVSL